jgi:hypothetical protein
VPAFAIGNFGNLGFSFGATNMIADGLADLLPQILQIQATINSGIPCDENLGNFAKVQLPFLYGQHFDTMV